MDENMIKINQIISECNAIYDDHLIIKREREFMPLASLNSGIFLSIHKRTLALIPKFGYAEEDIDKLFTHGTKKSGSLYIKNYIDFLESIRDHPLPEEKEHLTFNVVELLEKIFKNFQRCYRQLLIRHNQRDTLKITDEYDVQDLLHAILKLHFDDVRAEVSTPKYGGGNSRIDFILNEHDVAIEVKKTRNNLKDKEIGEELLIDIARYQQSYSKIKLLICFVYDPEGLIINPIGLENDLNITPSNIPIKTIICPKH
jgi:hypothetical protein